MKPGMPPSEKELKSVVWLHVFGDTRWNRLIHLSSDTTAPRGEG